MIFIDGDSCSVIKTTEVIAKANSIPCHIYCDTNRYIESDYSEVHFVEAGHDSTDFAILNKCGKNDIVITNDSGLAAMVIAKNGFAISNKGFEYTKYNINSYLTSRYIRNREIRHTKRNNIKGIKRDNIPPYINYKYTLKKVIKRLEVI